MKNLYLIRHGKSSWDDSSLPDKERPLKRRGEKDASLMAKLLVNRKIVPDAFVSSPANRALSTAKIMAEKMGFDKKEIAVNALLYFQGMENILQVIHQLNERHNTVFIFGHNPDFTELANRYSQKTIDNVPTTGVAGIEFKVKSWKDVSLKNGRLIFFEYPSNHK